MVRMAPVEVPLPLGSAVHSKQHHDVFQLASPWLSSIHKYRHAGPYQRQTESKLGGVPCGSRFNMLPCHSDIIELMLPPVTKTYSTVLLN